MEQLLLWKETGVRRISPKEAAPFIQRWHYSRRMPTGKNISYGLFLNGTLYAVIVYGIGVNCYQASFLGCHSVLEIKRMARVEPPQDYPLSKLISQTIKMLCSVHPVDAIVAFADPEQGHHGGVYKASGFVYLGKTKAEYHLLDKKTGAIRHRLYAYRYAQRNKISTPEARAQLGVEIIKTQPRHRWIRWLSTYHNRSLSHERRRKQSLATQSNLGLVTRA